jgi:hypothetical protein
MVRGVETNSRHQRFALNVKKAAVLSENDKKHHPQQRGKFDVRILLLQEKISIQCVNRNLGIQKRVRIRGVALFSNLKSVLDVLPAGHHINISSTF